MATHVFVVVTSGLKSAQQLSNPSAGFFSKGRTFTIDLNEIRIFLNYQKKKNFLSFRWYLTAILATTGLNINIEDLKI